MADHHLQGLRVAARAALGSGASWRRAAELELVVHGGLVADPQIALDQAFLRACLGPGIFACVGPGMRGRQWAPEPAKWRNALRAGQGSKLFTYRGVYLSSRLRSQRGTALQMGGAVRYKLEVYRQYFSDKLYGLGPEHCPIFEAPTCLKQLCFLKPQYWSGLKPYY